MSSDPLPSGLWHLGGELWVVATGSSLVRAVSTVIGPPSPARVEPAPGRRVIHHDLVPDGGTGSVLRVEGVSAGWVRSELELAPVLEAILVGYAVRTRTTHAALRAATVEIDGSGVLLVDGMGGGKSSLSLCLADAGAAYWGDELSFVGFEDGLLEAFPKAVSVTQDFFGFFPDAPTHLDPIRGEVRYYRPSGAVAYGASGISIGLIVQLTYAPKGTGVRIQRLHPEQLAADLVQQCFGGLGRGPSTLDVVGALAHRRACRLEFADPREAAIAIRKMLA